MDKRYKHPRIGDILLRQRRTLRRISLSLKPSGEVRLSFPNAVSIAKALDFLEQKEEWVLQAKERMAKRTVALQYSPERIEALRCEAKRVLPAMVERLAHKHGFSYGHITIRATRSKWGCCTSQNNISLSLFLMTLPIHLQEFVVLHELCHTVHHNHSAEFHALLNKVTGGREKELNRQLKGIRKFLRFRKGEAKDLDSVMALVAGAQNWLASNGVDQWQDGYPSREQISSDISGGVNYVVESNGVVVATAVVSFDGEPTYAKIVGKGWLNSNRYAVVHRIAVSAEYRSKGIAKEILHYTEELCVENGIFDIRIDTHRNNRAMRSLIKKMGYRHCGRITLASGASREAYHKVLNS